MEDFSAIRMTPNTSFQPFPAHPSMSIDRLFPALLECFGIILCGYASGRAKIITETQAKGLGSFVSKFALPALLFKNMVLLDFDNVVWSFLWGILIAKVTVFVIVCALTLLVASPETRLSKAGLFSIFATQSNDFALGYPIVEALYKNTYPEYLQYIYLVAPISLMILNPIGFAFCEVQKWRQSQDQRQNKMQIVVVVVLRVLKNPIVLMVVVGLVFHFLLSQRVPAFMEEFVDGLANSFGGTALFYLGLSMVGQLRKLTRSTAVALILLITAKLLVMPQICRDMVEVLDKGTANTSSLNHSSLSNYAFLYGVFPTAPSVAIYAAQYNMELEVVTSGMVISTFLSAPIMYFSAWLLTIPWMDPKLLASELQSIGFKISIVSLVAVVWTISIMLLRKKYRRLPHMFTSHLLLAQFLVCVSMILWNFVSAQDSFALQVLTFTFLYGSLYSTYVWTGLIALSLALTKKDDELKVQPAVFVILGWGEKMPDNIDSAFFYGTSQIISTVVVLACSILLSGASLMALSRGTQESSYQAWEQEEDPRTHSWLENQAATESPATDRSDLRGECGEECGLLVHEEEVEEEQEEEEGEDKQVARHVLLSVLLTVCQLAVLSSCLWWLFDHIPGRLYLELQVFCLMANYGQGLISFGLFGLDKHLIILPFKKRLASLWHGRKQEAEPQSAVSEEIRLTCMQFTQCHKDLCVQDIVKRRRCGARAAVGSFLGSEMADWLVRKGLARDPDEAVLYGTQLMQGGVLKGVAHKLGFQDDGLLYCFCERGRLER